jgi:flagellar hook-length control protein FliK
MPQPPEPAVGKAGLAQNAAQPLAQTGSSPADETLPPITLLGVEAPLDGAESGQDTLSEAAAKAKQLLAQALSPKAEDSSDVDVDKLQNTLAKADTTQPFALRFKPVVNAAAEAPLADQLLDGVKQNLSLGKSTFVVKLNPAELGEITVRLVEEAGKTTLTLAAANAHTAKLLNHDLAALRDAVAPMNVEVREAVVATNETAGGTMQQFNLAGQQFAQQQFAGSQGFYTAAQGQSSAQQPTEESYEAAQPLSSLRYSTNRLDAYV